MGNHPLPLGRVRPTLARFILELSRDFREAYAAVRRLRVELLSPDTAPLDLVDVADELESKLKDRIDLLTEAEAEPHATGATITAALIEELARIRNSRPGPHALPDPSFAVPAPDEDSILEALTGRKSAAFRTITNLLSTLDTSTAEGRRDILAAAFDGDCVVAVRVLLSTTEMGDALAKRHSTLAMLNELRMHRLAYFDYLLCLETDPQSASFGTVPHRMLKYSLASEHNVTLLNGLLGLQFDTEDWIAAPHGLMGLKQRRDGALQPIVHDKRDYFCQPQLITELCQFLHVLLTGIGGVATSSSGFTFLTLGAFFSNHLNKATRQTTETQVVNWVIRASNQFQSALTAIRLRLRSIILAARPADVTLKTHILEFDAACIQPLRNAERLVEEIADRRAEQEALDGAPSGSSSGAAHNSYSLPLLSKVKSLTPANPGKTKEVDKKTLNKRLLEETPALTASEGLPHGCLRNSWKLLSGNKLLIISGKAWDLPKCSRKLGIPLQGPCWPFLLSLCEDKNRLARCDKVNDSKHAAADSEAHKWLSKVLALGHDALAEECAKPATAAQKANLSNKPDFGQGKGQGRGRGRGQGGKRVRGGQRDDAEDEDKLPPFRQLLGD